MKTKLRLSWQQPFSPVQVLNTEEKMIGLNLEMDHHHFFLSLRASAAMYLRVKQKDGGAGWLMGHAEAVTCHLAK